jgi:nicotinate phosphoribosyltransferase
LATCYDQPALGGVYKLIEIDNEPKLKIAGEVEKTTVPAKKQVYRVYNKEDLMIGDVIELNDYPFSEEEYIYDFSTPSNSYKLNDSSKVEPLLNLKMKNGKLIGKIQDWRGARKRMEEDLSHLSEASKVILNPEQYKVGISQSLYDLRIKLIETYSIKS